MAKEIFKLNKKLGQGLNTLYKAEQIKIEHFLSNENTNRFILLHFGDGRENDFEVISNLLKEIKIENFMLDLYPGYPHGFLSI